MPLDQFTRPARNLVVLGMLLPSLSISIAAFLAHMDHVRIQQSYEWIMQTVRAQDQIQGLVADIVEVETDQRGFLLTGRHSYLQPFESACKRVSVDLAALHRQMADDPMQQERLERIETLVNEKIEIARQTLALEQSGDHAPAVKLVRADREKKTMEAVRQLADEMGHKEEGRLRDRQQGLSTQTRNDARGLYLLLGLNTVSILCIFILLRSLSRLRSIVRMCAWSRMIEFDGNWISFEKYLERRFNIDITHGIAPSEIEKLMSSLPPESNAEPEDRAKSA